jgi:hypothetical protein
MTDNPLERLKAVQRKEYTLLNRGMHIYSPTSDSHFEELYVRKGGGSVNVYYDIPSLAYNVSSGRAADDKHSLLQFPRDGHVEIILSLPQNASCWPRPSVTKQDSIGAAPRLKNKGAAKALSIDACGGYYGEVAIPLSTAKGRVKLKNLGSGQYSARFRLIDATGSPILIKQSAKTSDTTDTLGSVSFTVNNQTMKVTDDDSDSSVWENTHMTRKLWDIVHVGTLLDLKALDDEDGVAIHTRSREGRGILWWAYENGRADMVRYLISKHVVQDSIDSHGSMAHQMEDLYVQKETADKEAKRIRREERISREYNIIDE